jgi:putative hydrolase of HD superfamily
MTNRLRKQITFLKEIDQLKTILRQTWLTDQSRRENSAEHSWHLALCAIVLAEYAPPQVELFKALKMVLLHDLVEIDAGDTFCYDHLGNEDKLLREQAAATRLFSLLPIEQREELKGLWEEFEQKETATAQWADALDRLQPLLLNWQNGGITWREHQITLEQVQERIAPITKVMPQLETLIAEIMKDCLELGVF